MRAARRYLRAWTWLALVSIVGLAVGPTVSRLVLPSGGPFEHWSGAYARSPFQKTSLTTSPSGTDPSHHHHHDIASGTGSAPAEGNLPTHDHALEHCGLCVVAAHAFTFVQQWPALVALRQQARPLNASIATRLPRLRSDWSPASSRGPPSLG
jgi:Protein of unknown function (DUF2946).